MEMATVNCAVIRGDAPIEITWKFNDDKYLLNFNNENGILITKSGPRISVLSIESVASKHRGNYTCIAENIAGLVKLTAELHVNGLQSYFWILIMSLVFCFFFLILFSYTSNITFPIRR